MLPAIRHVGFIDILVSLGHITFVSVGFYRGGEHPMNAMKENAPNQGVIDQRRHVFYLLSHFLLILRLISAVVLFGASFKNQFRKQFDACILWIFIAMVTMIILGVQLCICKLSGMEIIVIVLEILFRLTCGFVVIRYMKNEKE